MQQGPFVLTVPEVEAFHALFDSAKEVKLPGDRIAHRIVDPHVIITAMLGSVDRARSFVQRLVRLAMMEPAFRDGKRESMVYDVNVEKFLVASENIVRAAEPPLSEEERALLAKASRLHDVIACANDDIADLESRLTEARRRKEAASREVAQLDELIEQLAAFRTKVAEAIG